MSKVNNMKLEDILKITKVFLFSVDILYFCEDIKVVQEYFSLYEQCNRDFKKIETFLIKHEDKIDKEKLVFCIYLNYEKNIESLNNTLRKLEKDKIKNFREITEYRRNIVVQENIAQQIRKTFKDLDTYLWLSEQLGEKRHTEIFSSKEIFTNQRRSENKKLERIRQIDKEIGINRDDGSSLLLQWLVLTDLKFLLPDDACGLELRHTILANGLLKRDGVNSDKLNKMKAEDIDSYTDLIDSVNANEYLSELRSEVINNIRFIDVDKLFLTIIYRLEEYLELEEDRKIDPNTTKAIILYTSEYIKNKKVKFKETLEKRGTFEPEQVEYSYNDVEKLLNRIVGNSYIKKSEVNQTKLELKNGTIGLGDIEPIIFGVIDITEEDFQEIMQHSDENFVFTIEKFNYDDKKIVQKMKQFPDRINLSVLSYLYCRERISIWSINELYSEGLISAEFFKEFSEENDISSEINLQKINEQYLLVKKQREPKEDVDKLNKIIELYKIVNVEDKTQEELEELSDSVMYEIAEDFEDEEDILFYYEKGLVTLRTVAEWSGESTIEKLYNEGKITFEDVENANIGIDIKQTVLGKYIMAKVETYSQDELLEYINKGYLSEKNIYDIYKIALLNETYAENMLYNGIISVPTYAQITNIGKEILEEQADTRFSSLIAMGARNFSINLMKDEMEESDIAIGDVPVSKKKSEQGDEGTGKASKYNFSTSKSETLIDPNVRWEFLKALKCKLPKDKEINNQDPNNPFYNYEFYVIESDNDEAEKDSIVIAERFFKDKSTEDEYATSNATYIWQYKDYLIAQRMLKSEQKKNKKAVLQETEGVVYVANHRPGSWAVSLLYKIAQAKAGKSFEEYKRTDKGANKVLEQLEKLYTHEELIRILDLAKIIDDDQKVTTTDGKEVGIVYDVIKEDKRIESRKNNGHGEGGHGDEDGR